MLCEFHVSQQPSCLVPPAVVPVAADGDARGAGVEGAAVRPPRALVHARLLVPKAALAAAQAVTVCACVIRQEWETPSSEVDRQVGWAT